jgi:serine/threonine protein kinase
VFLVADKTLERRIVVKVLRPKLASGVSAERFKREIRLMERLQHPNIVPIVATGEVLWTGSKPADAMALPFFTMLFVEGDTLRARLSRDGPLAVDEAVRTMRDVASALELAHANGIVHRDIKPENVLLSGGGATVADFGVAKALSASTIGDQDETKLTRQGITLGTPLYMAPEQALGYSDIDHRADIYALGVVGYEMFAGRPPFMGLSGLALLAAQMNDTPQPIGKLCGDLPRSLAHLVTRCLAKDPSARPQSAAEVLRGLDTGAPFGVI